VVTLSIRDSRMDKYPGEPSARDDDCHCWASESRPGKYAWSHADRLVLQTGWLVAADR
jgi:hypothetical protein